ncbi:MAG: hypothetical protein WD894_27035 [Pirellulales bacterium]
MPRTLSPSRYLLCIKNDGYPTSLEVRKIYQAMADADAEKHRLVRVIDESGEDYLYPQKFFVRVELPSVAKKAFAAAS